MMGDQWLLDTSVQSQGSHRTWKVLEFETLDSRPGKSWNFCRGPWKSWNLGILIYISNHKRTGIQLLHFFRNMGVSLHIKSSWIHWKGPWIWHWKVLESPGSWDVKLCMNPELPMRHQLSDRDIWVLKNYLGLIAGTYSILLVKTIYLVTLSLYIYIYI